MRYRNQYKGFTLIELSIVLVIIGLIVGGVLVGRDLIKGAEIRSVISQIETYRTATNAFRLKYNCLPGDCAFATSLGLGTSGGVGDNGNGDDIAAQVSNWGVNSAEGYNYWYHLSQASLIDGQFQGYLGPDPGKVPVEGLDYPSIKLAKGGIWLGQPGPIVTSSGNPATGWKNVYWITSFPTDHDPGIAAGVLTPYENYVIDAKLDDGIPSRGTIRLSTSTDHGMGPMMEVTALNANNNNPGYPYGIGSSSTNKCGFRDTTPATYNVGNTSRDSQTLCTLEIKAGF